MNPEYIKKDAEGNTSYYKDKEMSILHREDGPAWQGADGTEEWFKNGEIHREDGPAVVFPDGDKEWWLNNKEYTEEEFLEKRKMLLVSDEINKSKDLSDHNAITQKAIEKFHVMFESSRGKIKTPRTDSINSEEGLHVTSRYDKMHDLAERLEIELVEKENAFQAALSSAIYLNDRLKRVENRPENKEILDFAIKVVSKLEGKLHCEDKCKCSGRTEFSAIKSELDSLIKKYNE